MASSQRKAVILLSGGLDSATCLAIAKHEGYALFAISFRYGQRHLQELDMARQIARSYEVDQHIVVDFDMNTIKGSALIGDGEIPKARTLSQISEGIPVTYVPARNTIFLSFALAWAEVLGAGDIFIGVNAVDYSGYPDCRPEYIKAFAHMADLATKTGVEGNQIRIHTPLIQLTKAEIIKKAVSLGLDFAMTHSCYDPPVGRPSCGLCDSCLLRKKGFAEAGIIDPTASPSG